MARYYFGTFVFYERRFVLSIFFMGIYYMIKISFYDMLCYNFSRLTTPLISTVCRLRICKKLKNINDLIEATK